MVRPLFVLLTVLIACISIRAADPRYNVRRIMAADGQPWGVIYSIIQDRQGFIWFGTANGLHRYDGYGYRSYHYDALSPYGLSGMRVSCIAEDSAGNIWAGTYAAGLNRLDRRTDRITRFAHDPSDRASLSSDMIRGLVTDGQGNVWIATSDGLDRYDARTGAIRRYDVGVPTSVYIDSRGRLWASCYRVHGGIFIVRHEASTGTFTRWPLVDEPMRQYRIIADRPDGSLVIGFANHSNRNLAEPGFVRRFDPITGAMTPYVVAATAEAQQRAKLAITVDHEGKCWYAAVAGARSAQGFHPHYALHAEPLTIATRTPAPSLQNADPIVTGYPMCAVVDRSGSVWLGMEDGLWRLSRRGAGITTWRHDPLNDATLSESRIRSVLVSKRGHLWASTDFGLNRYDPAKKAWKRYFAGDTAKGALPNNTVNVMYQGADGVLYMGTNGGLVAYDHERDRFYDPLPQLRQPDGNPLVVWSICRDRKGYLWVGTRYAGLARCSPDGRTVDWYTHRPSDPQSILPDGVWSLLEDHTGTFWIGTEYGLCRLVDANGRFHQYRPNRADSMSIVGTRIWCLFEDRTGTLWATSFGGGISRYDRETDRFSNITIRNGLPANAVVGMMQDAAGVYWIPTSSGLVRWDPATRRFKTYDRGDGFQGNEFTFKAFHAASNGRLYVGGINGLSTFDPTSLRDNDHVPPIVITGFRVFDSLATSSVLDGDTVHLTYAQNFFSIEFSALSYANPGKNRYAYRLEGVDADWVSTTSDRRVASYTDLAPGTYTFRVRGSNNDGYWNDRGVTITIVITPPWWGTWQFRILSGLVLLLGIITIVRVRTHVIRRHAREKANSALQAALESQEAERQRIARDLHDGIGQLLAAASINLTRVRDALMRGASPPDGAASVVEPLERTQWIIDRTTTDVRTLSHALGISTLQELGLAAAISELLDSLPAGTLIVERTFIGLDGRLPEHVEIGLFRIAQELIANVLRHSDATEASVQLMRQADEVRLTVEDNGRGFDVALVPHGMGLRNITARAAAIDGDIHLDAQPGRGTTVTVVVRLRSS